MLANKEKSPSIKTPDSSFEQVVEALVDKGLQLVSELNSRKREGVQEGSPQASEKLPYHNVEHTKSVIKRFEKIILALNSTDRELVNSRDIALGKIAAAFHDVVQNFEMVTKEDGGLTKIVRSRAFRINESLSADMAVEYMEKIGGDTFTKEDTEKVRRMILMTVPSFDPKTGYVSQPNLNNEEQYPNITYIERAVAMADLGTSGMEGGDKFNKEGDTLFLEDNPDILDTIYKIKAGEGIDDKYAKHYAERMKKWLEGQIKFIEGRVITTDAELAFFPAEVRVPLKENVFNKFEDALNKAKELYEKRKDMSFQELVNDMGHTFS